MTRALEAINKVPGMCPTVLQDPAPCAFYEGFGNAVNLRLAVWFKGEDLIQTKNDVYINTVKVFNEYGDVSIPFTRYDIKIIEDDKKPVKVPAAKKVSTAKKTASKK